MFIQVVTGKAKDPAAMRAASEGWEAEIKPGAKGYLGATEGVADDGTFVAVVRFDSEEAAKANSDRPEQSAWWEKTSKLFEGDVDFFDCPRVETFQGGGSDDAGFVQVMIYKPTDVDKLLGYSKEFEKMSSLRPDILGGSTGVAKDGTCIDTLYFKSEKEAREGEKQEMPAEMQKVMEEVGALMGPVEYVDLRDPWLYSA